MITKTTAQRASLDFSTDPQTRPVHKRGNTRAKGTSCLDEGYESPMGMIVPLEIHDAQLPPSVRSFWSVVCCGLYDPLGSDEVIQ
jgi:hypothetical protein